MRGAILASAILLSSVISAHAIDGQVEPLSGPGWYQEKPFSPKAQKRHSRKAAQSTVSRIVSAPSRFISGSLKCAVNVNAALAARGIRGTNSALAKSFLHWGRPSGPVPGAVVVTNRKGGGPVAIVAKVEGDKVWVHNPSQRKNAWVLAPLRQTAMAFRVP